MAAKTSIKMKAVMVPKNIDEAVQFVREIRWAEDQIRNIEANNKEKVSQFEAKIAELNQSAKDDAKPHLTEIETLSRGVWAFATANRQELLKDEVKTFELSSGDKLRWYLPPPHIEVKDEEAALKELKRKELTEFIRVSEEINKEAILADPEKVKGLKMISIERGDEIFAIVLTYMGIELQKGERKFKKVAV